MGKRFQSSFWHSPYLARSDCPGVLCYQTGKPCLPPTTHEEGITSHQGYCIHTIIVNHSKYYNFSISIFILIGLCVAGLEWFKVLRNLCYRNISYVYWDYSCYVAILFNSQRKILLITSLRKIPHLILLLIKV